MSLRKKNLLGVLVASTIVVSTIVANGTTTFASDFNIGNIKNNILANTNINNGNSDAIINGHNDRVQITDAAKAPYSSVCYINIGGKGRASAVVVGKNTILTNRHAVGSGGDGSKISIYVGQTSRTQYLGSFKGETVIGYPDKNIDLALVHVKPNNDGKSIGEVGSVAKCADNPPTPINTPVRVIGYPADIKGQNMWESFGVTTSSQLPDKIRYNAATAGGSSGSPIFNTNNEVIGINFGSAGSKFNAGIRISSKVYKFIEDNVK